MFTSPVPGSNRGYGGNDIFMGSITAKSIVSEVMHQLKRYTLSVQGGVFEHVWQAQSIRVLL